MNKVLISAALTALVVALGVSLLFPVKVETIVERVIEQVGSIVGPDVYFPYSADNNLRVYTVEGSIVSSTTPCTIAVPLYNEASTTLIYAGWRVMSAPTTTAEFRIFTSLAQNATTTQLAGISVANTATGTLVTATTTLTSSDVIMSAGDRYVIFSVEGLSPYIAVGNRGQCSAQFKAVF